MSIIGYRLPKLIFDKLEEVGIQIHESRRCYPYFCAFDFKSYFEKKILPKGTTTNKLRFES